MRKAAGESTEENVRLQGLVVFLWYEVGSTAGWLGRGPVALKLCKCLIYFMPVYIS